MVQMAKYMNMKKISSSSGRELIEPRALLVVIDKGRVLLSKALDGSFVRPPGGHIEFFETSAAAVRREIKEEIGSTIRSLKLEKVIENLIYFYGKKVHDIYFIYSGSIYKKSLYKKDVIIGDENGEEKRFYWIKISDLTAGKEIVVPKGILEVILNLYKKK